MKAKLIILLTVILITGCASNSNIKNKSKPYNDSNSFAYNVMSIASPIPWDLKDANIAMPEQYSDEKSWGFEVSQAVAGASKDMSSLGSILSGGASMGLLALATPEVPGARDQPWTIMFISSEQLNKYNGDLHHKAFQAYTDRIFGIVRNNYIAHPGNKTLTLDSEPVYEDSLILGENYKMNFINNDPDLNLRKCKSRCYSRIIKSRLFITGPSNYPISNVDLTKDEYYVISYRFMMSSYNPLKIHNFNAYFKDDVFFYHNDYDFNKALTDGIPALLSKDGARLFVKPNNTSISQAQ